MHERSVERQNLLTFLYGARAADSVGWLPYAVIAEVIPRPDFALGVLVERGDVEKCGSQFRITANGCEIVEALGEALRHEGIGEQP